MEFAQDAAGALAHPRSLPFVDPKRVAIIGWSYGAGVALIVARGSYEWLFRPAPNGFRAAVAFYPPCRHIGADTSIPLLLLLGEADDWTPPGWCVTIAQQVQQRHQTIEWVVYPRATHAFDSNEYGFGARQYLGHLMQYNASAAADAQQRVRAFLREQLR